MEEKIIKKMKFTKLKVKLNMQLNKVILNNRVNNQLKFNNNKSNKKNYNKDNNNNNKFNNNNNNSSNNRNMSKIFLSKLLLIKFQSKSNYVSTKLIFLAYIILVIIINWKFRCK